MTPSNPTLRETPLNPRENLIFDYHTLRLIVGVLAFVLPWVVSWLAGQIPSSISGSYNYAGSRDVFVGSLFIIGTLLVAYQGHRPRLPVGQVGWFWSGVGGFLNAITGPWRGDFDFRVAGRQNEEDLVSTLGGLAAIVAALFPTNRDGVPANATAHIHGLAGGILFTTVAYYCLIAFLRSVTSKLNTGIGFINFLRGLGGIGPADRLKKIRGLIYVGCGLIIAVTLIAYVAAPALLPATDPTFWVEVICLTLFGVSWVTACQLPFLLDENEKKPVKASP
jgi:hypothetical protein